MSLGAEYMLSDVLSGIATPVATLLAAALGAWFGSWNSNRTYIRNKEDAWTTGLLLIETELTIMEKHFRDNVGALIMVRKFASDGSFSNKVDYLKLKYSEGSFLYLKNEQVLDVDKRVMELLFRLTLFQRNTNLHVEEAISVIFDAERSAGVKTKRLDFLVKRMIRTWDICIRLKVMLNNYRHNRAASLDDEDMIPRKYFYVDPSGPEVDESLLQQYGATGEISLEMIENFASTLEPQFSLRSRS